VLVTRDLTYEARTLAVPAERELAHIDTTYSALKGRELIYYVKTVAVLWN
jgi:hypothetical protein